MQKMNGGIKYRAHKVRRPIFFEKTNESPNANKGRDSISDIIGARAGTALGSFPPAIQKKDCHMMHPERKQTTSTATTVSILCQ